jgi:glucose/mannose-6-phosphate isomerase
VAITAGGTLLQMAKENNIPHILVPSGFEPRNAFFYILRALLYVLNKDALLSEPKELASVLNDAHLAGESLGKSFENHIPLIYSSRKNQALSHIWKIMLNETGKIPAFNNYFPELAHNEMQGIVPETSGQLGKNLKVFLLTDSEDDERILSKMRVFQNLASSHDLDVVSLELPSGATPKLIYTFIAARSAALVIARLHGVEADEVPFIELFKKSL